MRNLEWLMANGRCETVLDMVEEGDNTNTEKPWCKTYTTDSGDCPGHCTCGICRRDWLEREADAAATFATQADVDAAMLALCLQADEDLCGGDLAHQMMDVLAMQRDVSLSAAFG